MYDENINKIGDKPEKREERLYTSEDLENIVEQRLSRERKNNESYAKIRELIGILRRTEPFKKLSNAAVAEKIAILAQNSAEQNKAIAESDIKAANPDAAENSITEIAKDTETFNADNTGKGMPGSNLRSDTEPADALLADNEKIRRLNEIDRFCLSYGKSALENALKDRAFREFCAGKDGDIMSLYESYQNFLEMLSSSPAAKRYRAAEQGLASTGFSGNASPSADYGSLLTENQKRIAASAGMSYRQYAELLEQIPSKMPGTRKV